MSSFNSPAAPVHRVLKNTSSDRIRPTSLLISQSHRSGQTVSPVEDRLASARAQGYSEGYQAALGEAQAAEIASRSAQLRRVADSLAESAAKVSVSRTEVLHDVVVDVVELACQLAESILQRELIGRDALVEALGRALALAPAGHDVEVRLNPCERIGTDDLERLSEGRQILLIEDSKVEIGGCVLTAGPSRIDTQVGPALDRCRDVLADLYPAAVAARTTEDVR